MLVAKEKDAGARPGLQAHRMLGLTRRVEKDILFTTKSRSRVWRVDHVEAQQGIEQAKGYAESQRLQQMSLTPMYLELKAIEKWDGKLPQVTSGNGTVPFIEIPNRP